MVFCDFFGVTEFFSVVAEIFSGWRRGSRGFGEGFSDKAQRRCPAGRRLGSGQPPAQHKSIAGGRLSRAPAAIVSGQEPESRDAGVSRFRRNGSHLAVAGAAEGHAWQVDGSGSSGNAGTGSHLAAAGFSSGQEAVL